MNSYYIWTIGCQMNKADSERLESAFSQMGLSPTNAPKDANIIVLNSCVVRQSAEDKVVGTLTSLKPLKEDNPDLIVALTGCMVGPNTVELEKQFPYVDVFTPPQQYEPLIDLLSERTGIDTDGCIGTLTAQPSVSTYIPIIHGCNKFCSFCIIPYRRGREVSRTIQDIVHEAELLVQKGVKEVTLLGQNVDSYGQDLAEHQDLSHLLTAINNVEGIKRIRFLTSHPNDMSTPIIDSIADLDKVCEHINLPFQAGDDEILNQMRRGYTNQEYRILVEKIRKRIPSVSLSTDVIVGFSGETYGQFQQTYNLLNDIQFDKVHSAAYSTRAGTIAARKMKDDVPDKNKKARLRAIETLQSQVQAEINGKLVGQTVEVLVEGVKRGKAHGRSRNDKLVYLENAENRLGDLVNVEIRQATPWSLQGVITTLEKEFNKSKCHHN